MMKLWKGKYFDEEDLIADEFCASIGFDQRLWKEVREINKDEGVGRARPAFSLCRKSRL